ncbi:MAG: RNA 2',3'-cyclic phosphodiesterase [bacterium]|nr:RNA 2',3'-cyclic phosphodiesterase [bacterium]
MIRLFIALLIPDEVKSILFDHCNSVIENSSDYRWEEKDKIHLTLKFIGEVKEEFLPLITNEIEYVKSFSSFNCSISNFGFFYRFNEAKILWCNLDTDELIIPLIDELNMRLKKYSIEPETRKFKGHLTLMRVKRKVSEDFIRSFKEYKFSPVKFTANEIALVQSVLKPTGSEYKVLKIYELK